MQRWAEADVITVRNIARSDGSVSSALPARVLEDRPDYLALYIVKDTPFKDNYVVPPGERSEALENLTPSRERSYQDRTWRDETVRLYLPNSPYSIWALFDEHGVHSWYGNLEAPYVRTAIGIDTQDHALDLIMKPSGTWHWKDEAEFEHRLELGLDDQEQHERVRAAGLDLIKKFEAKTFPFDTDWRAWRVLRYEETPSLPEGWAKDFGTAALL